MMRTFKVFWKDYLMMCKQGVEFYKKHWKGMIVLLTTICGAELGWFFRDDIKDKIESKLESKKSEEEGPQ